MAREFSENEEAEHDFSKGSVSRHIMMQAVPLIIAQVLQLLYNVVDRIYIGHLPGANGLALTGIGLVFPIVSLISAFTNLFGMGGAPLCSIRRGAGNIEEAEKIMGNSVVLLFGSSFLLTAVCYLLKRPVLYLLGASDATYPYANTYLMIYLLGTVFFMLGNGMNNFITSQGFPKTAMCTTLLGAVINLILDPILIFGLGMGIEGAAIATVLAQLVSAVWVLKFLTGEKAILRLKRKWFRLDWPLVREITALGMSGFIMQATNCIAQIACNAMLSIYGGDLYIGIMTILNSVREIFSMPVQGITSGSQPVLGYNYGARKYERIRKGIRFMALSGGAYTAAAWAVLMLFPKPFLALFTGNREMIETGVRSLHLYFAGFVFMLFQFSGQSVFVALGKSKKAVFFSLFRKVVIVLPLTILLPRFLSDPVAGIFLAEPVSNVIGGLACFGTMYFTVYRKLGSMSEPV
ncbi:MAG: MATE family efflux transporter [Lachnospiraceae bacterium]|nr:MATE family efflux transporter [Lachnospiraceae bacterium]